MEVGTFVFLLTVCSVMTGLITEAIKKMTVVDEPNILAGIVALIVGVLTGLGYLLYAGLVFNFINIASIFLLALFSWLCAMLGYDKVIQTISQLK